MMQSQPNPRPDSSQDVVNGRIYQAPNIHRWYPVDAGLDRAETMALLAHQPAFAGRDVLDIGVGTGRTTRYLAGVARTYVGVDSSAPMIHYLRQRAPTVDARVADMRDLSAFQDESFDFAFASANVVDAVDHSGRQRTWSELRRVLRRTGVLMFSSHNRRYRHALRGPWLERVRNPATQAVH